MTTDTLDCSTNTEIATLPNLGSSERYLRYACAGGTVVTRTASEESDRESYHQALSQLARTLDSKPGVLLASSYEYPGRYRRWDIGFVNPPLMFEGRGRHLHVTALNARGEVLLPEIERAVNACEEVAQLVSEPLRLHLQIKSAKDEGSEEERSRRATVFSVLRAIIAHFKSEEDSFLGLFGAFGYDLTFQFEEIERRHDRGEEDRDLVLYLPDEILVVDHRVEVATTYRYDFLCRKSGAEELTETTGGYARLTVAEPYEAGRDHAPRCDHAPGEFANTVKLAQAHFRRGDLFEAVPGQVFSEVCRDAPSEVFARLQKSNPAPYGALINLCNKEYLVAASPEMFVRVRGRRVETCPISGTIKRGRDALEDAAQIKTLLNSSKDEAELSMCTDVDRNDKARVCVPGSVEVIGRRQIELYSRLIHTVDHVSGTLRADMDALDAFLAHTWAVTVTGAPKLAAMQFVEANEKSARHWYGGAMGQLGFDGNINTGLTLRTLRIKDGVGEVRAGATLLSDSNPEEEEAETRLKASALLSALRGDTETFHNAADNDVNPCSESSENNESTESSTQTKRDKPLRALMVDHQDSFVHNLASYFRKGGVALTTLRPDAARQVLEKMVKNEAAETPDILILSPGPGRPADFDVAGTLSLAEAAGLPVFGVCLGLQGIVEFYGGSLRQLESPMHGKCSPVTHDGSALFSGIAPSFNAGRYHSLVAEHLPSCLRVTARSDDGEVMGIAHTSLPICALQFHPESIMTLEGGVGQQLIANVIAVLSESVPDC